MKTLLISDSAALGLMEERPEPAWRVGMTVLRNKDLLAPDFGAMHVAAYLLAHGFRFRVVNLVADIHTSAAAFAEPEADPESMSQAVIASEDSARASRRYLFSTLEHEQPDVIFLSLSIYNLALFTRKLLGDIREVCPQSTLVAGGIYSTFHAEEILSDGYADAVVRGEGEVTSAELLERLSTGRGLDGLEGVSYREQGRFLHNKARAPVADLDSLPNLYTVSDEFAVGKRFEFLTDLLPEPDWIAGAGFLTSRGCPEGCTFCLDPAINKRRTRFHSPSYVRDVLDYCAANFADGQGAFFFGDATFTMNKKRLARILDFLGDFPYSYQIQTRADYLDKPIIERLASAGVTNIAIGAETFNEKILREVVRKRLEVNRVIEAALEVRAAGMKPMLTFIIGLPGEGRDSILNTVDILKENGLFDATFFPLVVFRGTELFADFEARVSIEEMDTLRVNPVSEEYLCTGDHFPTAAELKGFTDYANALLSHHRPT